MPTTLKGMAQRLAREIGPGKLSVAEKAALLKEIFERIFSGSARGGSDFVLLSTYKALFRRLGVRGKTILDLGAGYSIPFQQGKTKSPRIILEQGGFLIPVDIGELCARSWFLVEKKTHDPLGMSWAPVRADVTKLPFGNHLIDGCKVTNLTNYPHENPHQFVRALFKEAHRVTKQGGFLVVSCFGYYRSTYPDGWMHLNNDFLPHLLIKPAELKRIARECGFRKIRNIPLSQAKMEYEVKKAFRNGRKWEKPLKKFKIIGACAFVATA